VIAICSMLLIRTTDCVAVPVLQPTVGCNAPSFGHFDLLAICRDYPGQFLAGVFDTSRMRSSGLLIPSPNSERAWKRA